MNPSYPVYVISKGRWESRFTVKSLEERKIPYRLVIEPQELEQYGAVVEYEKILVLPFSNLGQGSIPARNWCWEHSISIGSKRHWILDDNIRGFFRWHQNIKWITTDGATFKAIEDWADRYENVALAGMQYSMMRPRKWICAPISLNTRIYSCILIDNGIPFRWRGRYNEDTDLSLRVLKAGYCTAEFQAFLSGKETTMTIKGGNTDELYKGDGRLLMAQSLQRQHSDVARIGRRYGRWQHIVNYRPFRANKLRRKVSMERCTERNEYGMTLKRPVEVVNVASAKS